MKRVVITGMGLVTALGHTVEETWEALCQGRSGIGSIRNFDASEYPVRFAGEVRNFDPSCYLEYKEIRRNDPFTHLAVAASRQALAQARLSITEQFAPHIGVCIGSGVGGLMTLHEQFTVLHEKGPTRVSPFLVPMMMINAAPGMVSLLTGAQGPAWAAVSACATGGNALGEAWETIRRGAARAMLAGGAEKAVTPLAMAAFANMHALSRRNEDPQGASRPFDAERDGFVMGEGAGMLLLEDLDFALERGAPILAELVGYGSTADAYHITEPAPGGEGLVRAMERALQSARLLPEEVYQCAWDSDASQRCHGDPGHQDVFRQPRLPTGHQFDQIDAGAYLWCCRGYRGSDCCSEHCPRDYPSDDQSGSPRSGVRLGLCTPSGPSGRGKSGVI
jgi:3-oxoacyl-[acyl-carrier-protein] synthase II